MPRPSLCSWALPIGHAPVAGQTRAVGRPDAIAKTVLKAMQIRLPHRPPQKDGKVLRAQLVPSDRLGRLRTRKNAVSAPFTMSNDSNGVRLCNAKA